MTFADYTGPGRPFRGSTAWAAAQIERLLEEEERRRRTGRADAQRYSEPRNTAVTSGPLTSRYRDDPAFVLVDGTDWTLGGAALGGTVGAFSGGLLGAVGGGAACTPVAPGVGTLACGIGGAVEGATIGGGLGTAAGAAIGAGIDALTSDEEDEEREAFCDDRYAEETKMCNAIARKRGKRKAALCHASAAARYAACRQGLPLPPLITWNH